uniref:Uncharacterized protein n=1 Tax=Ananas comosus var. bracteatus TaxID=296719 RepID=A0A6V7NJG0_ANACO|nr:unnamed protein product [Ananas comosus var. bracteatus]
MKPNRVPRPLVFVMRVWECMDSLRTSIEQVPGTTVRTRTHPRPRRRRRQRRCRRWPRFLANSPPRIRREWNLPGEEPGLTEEEFKTAMGKLKKEVYNPKKKKTKTKTKTREGRGGAEEEGKGMCTICLEAFRSEGERARHALRSRVPQRLRRPLGEEPWEVPAL